MTNLSGPFGRCDSCTAVKLEQQLKNGVVPAAVPAAAPAASASAEVRSTASSKAGQPADLMAEPIPAPPRKEVTPFEAWPQVLDALRHSNTALHGALVNTNAYQYQEIILIDCDDPLFLEMIRTNDYAKSPFIRH